MSAAPLGRRGLEQLSAELSERDCDVVASVARFKFLSARQIEALHFADHASALAAARACRRVLERLSRDRLLTRLQRRIGGLRAGSASFVYGLGPIGDRLRRADGPRRRWKEPTTTFLTHTLAIAQLVIDLRGADGVELLVCETEPSCWRRFSNGLAGSESLKPDLFIALGIGEFEHRWFIEIDRGTEATTAVLRKCQVYQRYRATGTEQQHHDVFPRVLWITPTDTRAAQLHRALTTTKIHDDLFTVTTDAAAITLLQSGGEP